MEKKDKSGKEWKTMIKINCPDIIKTATGARLQAEVEVDGIKKVLWYEVESKYAKYLTNERADAFVVGLLWYALKYQHDIRILAPMSERLYYSINKYLAPLMAEIRGYKPIRLFCNVLTSEPLSNAHAVGTGLSCGIDSFSTICEHMADDVPEGYRITHFTFFNVGSHKDFGGPAAVRVFKARAQNVKACAAELDKELITVDSNLSDILHMGFALTHTHRSVSAALALQKLFKVYYYSSAIHLKDFKLSKKDPAYYDIFNLSMLSTETISFFSSCTNYNRVEKTRKVARFEPSYEYLNVCEMSTFNCGVCSKCLRTLLTLEVLGVLDKYKAIFNMKAYQEKRAKYIAKVKASYPKNHFFREIYDEMIRTKFLKK